MNRIQKVISKFERHGFAVENVGTSGWGYLQRYEAKRGDFLAGFSVDDRNDTVSKYKFKQHPQDEWTHVGNPTAVLREAGAMKARKPKNETSEQAKVRLLRRWVANLSVSDDELIATGFRTHEDINSAMNKMFPAMRGPRRRDTYKARQLRSRLNDRCADLWLRLQQAYKAKYPDQAPLRRVRVTASVDSPTDFRLDYYQNNQVAGDMPVFAWDSSEATNTVKMMLGELAYAQDYGVVALGNKEDAMQAFNMLSRSQAINGVKEEIKRQERALLEAQQAAELARKRLEYSKQKMDLASFIDGISNMTSMLAHAG